MYFGPRSHWGLEGVEDRTQMDPQLSPNLPTAWDSTWSPGALCNCRQMQNMQSAVWKFSGPRLSLPAVLNHAGFLWLKLKCSDTRCAENCIAQQYQEPP